MPATRFPSSRSYLAASACAQTLLLSALTLPACESSPGTVTSAAKSNTPSASTTATPSTRSPVTQGIDIINYPIDDSRGSVGRAFAAATDRPHPVPAEAAALWKRQGLRLLAVPLAELEPLLRDLPLAGSVQHQNFGPLTRWTPIAIGGSSSTPRVVAGLRDPRAASDLVLPPGRLRILARAWDEPVLDPSTTPPTPAARLRIELLPQHEQADPDLTTFIQAPKRSIDRAGRVFDELALAFLANPDEAYVIVPESPAISWQRGEDASNDQPAPTPASPPESATNQPPSLGEAMLSNAAFAGSARVKVIVVLIPRSAGVFSILAPSR